MFTRLFAILFGTLICALASAQSLDDRVRELERRVEQLEKEIGKQSTAPTSGQTTGGPDGWRQVGNWRSLKRGMTEAEVRSVLGEPQRVDNLSVTIVWHYGDGPSWGGRAQFDGRNQRLDSWMEPRR